MFALSLGAGARSSTKPSHKVHRVYACSRRNKVNNLLIMSGMTRSPLLFGRKLRRDPRLGGAIALPLDSDDARLFGYALLGGLVFFGTYLG